MDQQQTQQTEQIIVEMLEFLETSSEDEHDLDQQPKDTYNGADSLAKNNLQDNIITENLKNNMKTKELLKLSLTNSKEIDSEIDPDIKYDKPEPEPPFSSKFGHVDWHYKLESHCRRSNNNIYTQEVYKAIYQNAAGHPRNGSADYYQAAQNYVLFGKHFLDFPKNTQVLLNDKIYQNSVAESSSLIPNFSSCLYTKPNFIAPNISIPSSGGPSIAASTAAYYQILNNMQAQTRTALAANPGNSTAYGIFMGNKATYMASTPTTPSLIYNQHNTTTTNFISNSLANAALATSPTILYTNPLLTTTQQYLTQFLSAAALTSNSVQSSTTVSSNAGSGNVYERLIYAQMLQQQVYQTQQSANVSANIPAMFQNKHRVVNPVSRQTTSVMNASSNRSSPQHLSAAPLSASANGVTLNSCYRQASSTAPRELAGLKPPPSIVVPAAETSEHSKLSSA